MPTPFAATDVLASVATFEKYLSNYRIDLPEIAPDLRVQINGDEATVVGLPVVDGFKTLDLTKRKLTKRLTLPLGLDCDVLLCGGTLISAVDNLPEDLRTLVVSNNARFKRWPESLPEGLQILDVSRTKLTSIGGCPPNLRILDCRFGEVVTLAPLPPLLEELHCAGNNLASLPDLPDRLEVLDTYGNPLSALPALPDGLVELDWRTRDLTSITVPAFPSTLRSLTWHHDAPTSETFALPDDLGELSITLTRAVAMPPGLRSLNLELADGVSMSDLPDSIEHLWYRGTSPLPTVLPAALTSLECGRNGLRELPLLPSGLTSLSCVQNQLTALPPLPNELTVLWCSGNLLTELPALPDSLTEINCEDNRLVAMPELSKSLRHLWCNGNQLMTLPRLDRWWDDIDTSRGYDSDQGLRRVHCQNNQIEEIPTLPKGLDELRCQHNKITKMPPIPISTTILNCSHNDLTSLTDLPPKLNQLFCNNNPELAVIDTYASEAFDRLHKSNATKTALDAETRARLKSWGVRTD